MSYAGSRSLPMFVTAFSLLVASTALATPMNVVLNGSITADTTGAIPLGTPFSVAMVLDTDTPNESLVPGTYLATTGLGTASIALLGSSLIADIAAIENAASVWTLTASVDLAQLGASGALDVAGPLSGTGLTPNQILPDFATITSGDIVVDLSGILGPDQFAIATITSTDITAVPEPTTALILGLGVAGLGVTGRRRSR